VPLPVLIATREAHKLPFTAAARSLIESNIF